MDGQLACRQPLSNLDGRQRSHFVATDNHEPRARHWLERPRHRALRRTGDRTTGRDWRSSHDSRTGAALEQLAVQILALSTANQHHGSAIRTGNLSLTGRADSFGRQAVGLGATGACKAHGSLLPRLAPKVVARARLVVHKESRIRLRAQRWSDDQRVKSAARRSLSYTPERPRPARLVCDAPPLTLVQTRCGCKPASAPSPS